MDNEVIIEWLGRWGKDWVRWEDAHKILFGIIGQPEREGYLERNTNQYVSNIQYRLTDKAIDKLKGVDNGDNTGNKT